MLVELRELAVDPSAAKRRFDGLILTNRGFVSAYLGELKPRKIAKLYQKLAEKEQEARSDYTKNNRPIKPRRNSNAMRECERYTSEAEECEIEAGRRLKKLKELVEGRSTAMPHAPHEPIGND